MQLNLSLDTLGNLDGGAARAVIDAAIRAAIADLDDRGHDQKPRVVTVTLTLQKMENGTALCDVQAGVKLPNLRTSATVANCKREGNRTQLQFQQFSPDDPSQRTIDEAGFNA